MGFGWLRAWRRSLTVQISLAIALVSSVLVAGSGLAVSAGATRELREGGEMVMIANLALLRADLEEARFDLAREAPRLVRRMGLQLGKLHLALLDEQRRVIAVSERFEVPLAALPAQPIDALLLPAGIDHEQVRALGRRLGPLSSVWTSADGRDQRVLFVRVPLPADSPSADGARAVLVVFAIELTQTRQIVRNELKVFGITLLIGTLASTLLGVLIARRIVAAPRRLAVAAGRISARPPTERLSVADTPTELIESTQAFNRMLDRLEAAFERLSAFSSDLAHDLRTPINNLLGEAQVALSRPRSADEYRAVLESAVEEYERLSRLIEAMLFLARADDPKAAIDRRWTPLAALLERGCGYFEMLAEERGVALRIAQQGAEPARQQVWADPALFVRALGNLISNALRYAPRGSSVVVSTQCLEPDARVILEVSNEGPAIALEHQQRIFERSYRVDDSRAGSATNSGLGLAIVKSIMDLHGGAVKVCSAPGERTVFSLHFPGEAAPAAAQNRK